MTAGWSVLGALGLGAIACGGFVACSSTKPTDDEPVPLPRRFEDPEEADAGGPDDPPELPEQPGTDDDGGVPDAGLVCSGKADGFSYDATKPLERCCAEQAVKITTTTNCGACGIKCPAGFACGQVRTGKYGCRCATDSSCVTAGYGTGATCYSSGNGMYCNCQCPGGAGSCADKCKGGATCRDVSGQNYCTY